MLYFSLAQCFAFRLPAGFNRFQSVFLLQTAHDGLLAFIVLRITDNGAIHADSVDQNVNVRMLGVRMFTDHILIIFKAHILQIVVGYLLPLLILKRFIRRYAQAHMAYGLAEVGA